MVWSERVWSQAWRLEDAYWESTSLINRDCKYLNMTSGVSSYSTWWAISDILPSLIRVSENLVKIVSRYSKLKADDYRLNGLSQSHKVCSRCDLYAIENIEHMLMQCPAYEEAQSEMYEEILRLIKQEYDDALTNHPEETLAWLLGGCIQYRHLISAPVDRTSTNVWLYERPC